MLLHKTRSVSRARTMASDSRVCSVVCDRRDKDLFSTLDFYRFTSIMDLDHIVMSEMVCLNVAPAKVLQSARQDTANGVTASESAFGNETRNKVISTRRPITTKQKFQGKTLSLLLTSVFFLTIIIPLAGGLDASSPRDFHIKKQKCALPYKNKSFVPFIDCTVPNIKGLGLSIPYVRELYFAGNNFTKIDPDAFEENHRLTSITILRNPDLIISPDSCFLNSTTIVSLDIENSNIPCLKPQAFECIPNLKTVYLRMTEHCPCTRELMEKSNKNITVKCDPLETIKNSGEVNKISKDTSRSTSINSREPDLWNLTTVSSDQPGFGTTPKVTEEDGDITTFQTDNNTILEIVYWIVGIFAILSIIILVILLIRYRVIIYDKISSIPNILMYLRHRDQQYLTRFGIRGIWTAGSRLLTDRNTSCPPNNTEQIVSVKSV